MDTAWICTDSKGTCIDYWLIAYNAMGSYDKPRPERTPYMKELTAFFMRLFLMDEIF